MISSSYTMNFNYDFSPEIPTVSGSTETILFPLMFPNFQKLLKMIMVSGSIMNVILKEIREYLGGTYNAHYASRESKTQTLDR